jgi:hypothetical protein
VSRVRGRGRGVCWKVHGCVLVREGGMVIGRGRNRLL